MNIPLAEIFTALAGRYTPAQTQVQNLWCEIESLHTETHRYYHTLSHLAQLYAALQPVWDTLEEPDAVLFALFYHDSIYNPQSGSNEAESAALARRRMGEIKVPETLIQKSVALILATQKHEFAYDWDTNIFTDADLSVLGAPWKDYQKYARDVRAEYAVYEDAVYAAGRVKVLEHFLALPHIFKTSSFFEALESRARRNLEAERVNYLKGLSG